MTRKRSTTKQSENGPKLVTVPASSWTLLPKKPPRRRTPYQRDRFKALSAFWLDQPKRSGVGPPYPHVLLKDETLGMFWFGRKVEERTSFVALGVMLDWCEDQGWLCHTIDSTQVPGYRYLRSVIPRFALRVLIPKEAP